jgi:phosphoribosylanthranilate isomerase
MAAFVKICGLTKAEDAIAAAALGATHLGFVFYPKSPRHIEPAAAEEIVTALKQSSYDEGFDLPALVGLFVDAGEKQIAEAAPFLTHFQFHGREPPDRCAAMRAAFGVEVIKAAPVGSQADVANAAAYDGAADMILFDARPPKDAERPGGHGKPFDWTLLSIYQGPTPFLLAGGLSPDTVDAAIRATQTHPSFVGVDVSSGVEQAPGRKSRGKIAAFIAAVRRASEAR